MNFDRPVFLIQNNYFNKLGRLIQPCLDFCRENDHDFIDRSLTDDFDPDALGVDWSDWPGVILYGSVGWVKRCLESSLAPWAYYDPSAFAASTWVPVLGDDALNGDGVVISIEDLEDRLAAGERLHVRPDADDKAFSGATYDLESWRRMIELRSIAQYRTPTPGLACFASGVKPIGAEHRCWFIDGVLVDVSTYRRGGETHIERCLGAQIRRAAERLGDIYLPMPNAVMDIAETEEGCKVIEFNPISSSGWYAADAGGIFWALSDMIRRGSAAGAHQ
jgi:hypothetical protein